MTETAPAARLERFTPAVVWAVWVGMTVGAGIYVGLYGLRMPFADEWQFIDVTTGRAEPTWDWIWSPHNDHRLPLARVVYLALGRSTGYDYRLMAMANVVCLSAAAAVMLRAAQYISGGTRLFHTLIPVSLLHWGHEINLTWSMQICFTLATLLASVLLCVMVSTRERLTLPAALTTALAALLLSMCGGWGLIYLPFAAAWLTWAGLRRAGAATNERTAGAAIALIGVGLFAACAAYGLNQPRSVPEFYSSSLGQTIGAAMNLLATGWGPIGKSIRPVSPLLITAAIIAGFCFLARAWRRETIDRVPAVGLLLYFCGGLTLLAAIAYGRAGQGATLQTRYGLGFVPLIISTVFLIARYGRFTFPRRLVGPAIVALAAIVIVNDLRGMLDGRRRRTAVQQVIDDARTGVTYAELGRRHHKTLHSSPAALAQYLSQLHASRISPYGDFSDRATPDDAAVPTSDARTADAIDELRR